jgi:hypothetical protein
VSGGKLRQRLRRAWIVGVVLYGAVRAMIVWKTLSGYGVNPWIYLVLDVTSSIPYAIYSAKLVEGLIDRKFERFYQNFIITALTFIAPDIYILISARSAPRHIYQIIIGVILALSLVSAYSLLRKVRQGRGEQ